MCAYPPRKPSNFVRIQTPQDTPTLDFRLPLTGYEALVDFPSMGEMLAGPGLGTVEARSLHVTIDPRVQWFTAPEAFFIDHQFTPLPPNFKVSDLKIFVQLIDYWMKEWVTTGSNTFIHARLYEDDFPPCLQIAFTTFSTYIHRTAANSDMVLRTVNDQATALLSKHGGRSSPTDVLDDLAVVHALLVYQMIGLFDGDIRSRFLAEERVPILALLQNLVLEKTSTELVRRISTNGSELAVDYDSCEDRTWRCWIISESIRRTWFIGRAIDTAYNGLKQGWAPCYGHVMITAREGLWSANCATAWKTMCLNHDVNFIGKDDTESLFEISPQEVDEFSKLLLQSRFGKERYLAWMHSLGEGSSQDHGP